MQELIELNTITKNSFFNNKEEKEIFEEDVFRYFLEIKIPVIACNKLISKRVLQENNIFFKDNIFHEDELFTFLLCFYSKKVLLIKDITYQYNRLNSNSITNNKSYKHFDDLCIIISDKIKFYADNRLDKNTDKIFLKIVLRDFTYILNHIIINSSRKIWIRYYKKMKTLYINSFLMEIEEHFLFSPIFAFYVHKIKNSNSRILRLLFKDKLGNINVV